MGPRSVNGAAVIPPPLPLARDMAQKPCGSDPAPIRGMPRPTAARSPDFRDRLPTTAAAISRPVSRAPAGVGQPFAAACVLKCTQDRLPERRRYLIRRSRYATTRFRRALHATHLTYPFDKSNSFYF